MANGYGKGIRRVVLDEQARYRLASA